MYSFGYFYFSENMDLVLIFFPWRNVQLWTNCWLQVRDRATLYLKTLGADGSVLENEKDVQEVLFGSLDLPLGNLETSLKNYVRCFNMVFLNLVYQSLSHLIAYGHRSLLKNRLILILYLRRWNPSHLLRRKAVVKNRMGLGLLPLPLPLLLMLMKRCFAPLKNLLTLGSFSRFFHSPYNILYANVHVFILGTSVLSLQSSASLELTEAETEYAVNVVKHIFDRHVVFQYNCTNTIPEQLLENVMPKIKCTFLMNHLENCFYNIVCLCRSMLLWMLQKQRNSRK